MHHSTCAVGTGQPFSIKSLLTSFKMNHPSSLLFTQYVESYERVWMCVCFMVGAGFYVEKDMLRILLRVTLTTPGAPLPGCHFETIFLLIASSS